MTLPIARPDIWSRYDSGTGPFVSLVIPTFNEADNITELLAQLTSAIPAELSAEVIFVDDSTDGTPSVIREAARHCRLPVSVLHRRKPARGLGGAVAAGLRLARAPWIVVMDADLQHPPSLALKLVAAGTEAEADVVVASRYVAGGSRAGLDGIHRTLASGLCTLLTRIAFRRHLRGVSDPMSGFFAVRASSLDPELLRPFGYKILLELIVRCQPARIVEVPYRFQERFAGVSKSGLREGWRFLRHVVALRFGSTRARIVQAVRYLPRTSERGPDRPHLLAQPVPTPTAAEPERLPTTR
jgi:dolichol-phosphate mannosyltransferase